MRLRSFVFLVVVVVLFSYRLPLSTRQTHAAWSHSTSCTRILITHLQPLVLWDRSAFWMVTTVWGKDAGEEQEQEQEARFLFWEKSSTGRKRKKFWKQKLFSERERERHTHDDDDDDDDERWRDLFFRLGRALGWGGDGCWVLWSGGELRNGVVQRSRRVGCQSAIHAGESRKEPEHHGLHDHHSGVLRLPSVHSWDCNATHSSKKRKEISSVPSHHSPTFFHSSIFARLFLGSAMQRRLRKDDGFVSQCSFHIAFT